MSLIREGLRATLRGSPPSTANPHVVMVPASRLLHGSEYASHDWTRPEQFQPGERLPYQLVKNFTGNYSQCIMCGRSDVHIPTQNKNICRLCDSSYWLSAMYKKVFKYCKGCKNFVFLEDFTDKPTGTKCERCRERERLVYLQRRQKLEPSSAWPRAVVKANVAVYEDPVGVRRSARRKSSVLYSEQEEHHSDDAIGEDYLPTDPLKRAVKRRAVGATADKENMPVQMTNVIPTATTGNNSDICVAVDTLFSSAYFANEREDGAVRQKSSKTGVGHSAVDAAADSHAHSSSIQDAVGWDDRPLVVKGFSGAKSAPTDESVAGDGAPEVTTGRRCSVRSSYASPSSSSPAASVSAPAALVTWPRNCPEGLVAAGSEALVSGEGAPSQAAAGTFVWDPQGDALLQLATLATLANP